MGRHPSCTCGECKKCLWNAYMRQWYRKTSDQRGRPAVGNRDPAVAIRSEAKRRGTPDRKRQLTENSKRMRAAHPDQYKARTAVGNALRDGRLTRKPCEECGEKGQAHHDDYSKPLEVRWLCGPHHRAAHGR